MSEGVAIWADRLAPLTGALAMLAIVVSLIQLVRARQKSPPRLDGAAARKWIPKGVLLTASLVLALFLLVQIVTWHARDLVPPALAQGAKPELLINGKKAVNQSVLLEAMRSMQPLAPHHSHAGVRFRVEIVSSAGNLELELGRDSTRPDEYWVFMPRYWVTSTHEIGRITSPAFSGY